jgi:hypothetical protein
MPGIIQAKLVGGFGNQLHQYVAARKYAESIGATLEVPEWTGKTIFDLTEPPWSCDLPEVNDGGCGIPPELEWGQTNIRLGGYFQMQRWIGLLSRAELKRWLRVSSQFEGLGSIVHTAAHLRQGDYLGHPLFANVLRSSYVRACAEYNLTVDSWVCQDAPRTVVGLDSRLCYLPDFLTLKNATILLRANSTFSWWAATLGDHAAVYAPVVTDHVGVYDADFVRGNWPRCADTKRVGIHVDDLYLPD